MFTYIIKDLHTGKTVGRAYELRASASRRAEKMNLRYGAHRYAVFSLSK